MFFTVGSWNVASYTDPALLVGELITIYYMVQMHKCSHDPALPLGEPTDSFYLFYQ